MKSLSTIIQEEETRRHNILKYKKSAQISAAIRVNTEGQAVMFLTIIFGYNLTYATQVAKFVRSYEGEFIDAPLIFEDGEFLSNKLKQASMEPIEHLEQWNI